MIRRLDVKIVLALIFTAVLPMIVSIYLVSKAIAISLGMGLNADIVIHLEQSLKIHKQYIEAIKLSHKNIVNHIIDSEVLAQAAKSKNKNNIKNALKQLLQSESSISIIRLIGDHDQLVEVTAINSPTSKHVRYVGKNASVNIEGYTLLEIVFIVDASVTENLVTTGKTMKTYKALAEAPPQYLSQRVIFVYVSMLGFVVIISFLTGILWTKKLVKRIHLLGQATTEIANGNMSIKVDPGSMDEVGMLVKSFNGMVSILDSNRSRIEYLQKIAVWQEMARRLAHEIKNPLTPIQLAAQQLQKKYDGDDPRFSKLLKQSTEIIEEEVATLKRLTSDFSSFAKLPQITPEPVDLKSFFKECKSSLFYLSQNNQINITWQIPDKTITVFLDKIMMKRVFDNLIRNAVEALVNIKSKNPKIKISTQLKRKQHLEEVTIKISDNGPGILPKYQSSLFNPYFTTKSEGTGLGLAISKKIILEHEGKIWIDENAVQGATFIIVLPKEH